jgi:hypothetical protein
VATLPPRKLPAAAAHAEATDLLQILVFRKALTREQAERVRRHARASGVAVVSTWNAIIRSAFLVAVCNS